MENIRSFIPKDKHDLESVNRLKELNPAMLKPVLPDLFEWVQDINWPVARGIAQILVSCGREMIPELKKVLESNDDDWKFACFGWIINDLPLEIVKELEPELKQIANQPSTIERDYELDDRAKNILKAISRP
ncbi:DUF5071 domain-containing protein [Brevibacillus sp. 179-C9.3 HS]|uniref:DUF5071 domain-containing protein n=1 Tax=unclassified Brevibacillus TaxID=2684853 RepID=UPI0039A1DC55